MREGGASYPSVLKRVGLSTDYLIKKKKNFQSYLLTKWRGDVAAPVTEGVPTEF